MKHPLTPEKPAPDIAIVSADGSVDITAKTGINIRDNDHIHAGAYHSVSANGGKIELTSTSFGGITLTSKMDGLQIINSGLKPLLMQSSGGEVKIEKENSGSMVIGTTGAIDMKSPHKITANVGDSTIKLGNIEIDIASKYGVKISSEHNVDIQVGNNSIKVGTNGISITSPDSVKINDLTVKKNTMSYGGKSANIMDVLKVKG